MRLTKPLSALSSPSQAVRSFAPSWFTVVMSTNIVAQTIATFPYDAPHKLEAGWAYWWFRLAQMVVFSVMLIGRLVFFHQDFLLLFSHPYEAMFLGAVPTALATVVNGFPTFLVHYWDPGPVMQAAVILWWIQAALALICTLLLPYSIFTTHSFELDKMSALWLLPILPCVVASGSGGIVALRCSEDSAIYILYMSYLLWGSGIPLSLMIMTIYLRRLMVYSIPPKELIVSSFLPVGIMGMGALALLNLGAAAVRIYPLPSAAEVAASLAGRAGQFDDSALKALAEANQGLIVSVTGVVVSFIMWGMGVWWLAVAVCSVISVCRTMTFNIGWWGFVFPMGVFTAAANELWRRLPNLESMRVVTAVLSCCTIALWSFVFAMTLYYGWNGSLLLARRGEPGELHLVQASGPGLEGFPDSLNLRNSSSTSEQQQQEGDEGDVEAQQGEQAQQGIGAAPDGLQRRAIGHPVS